MKHHRRKIITRMIVFLLLGAIVNVAVAWGLALGTALPDRDDVVTATMPYWKVTSSTSAFRGQTIISIRSHVDGGNLVYNLRFPSEVLPNWSPFAQPTATFSSATQPSSEMRMAQALGLPALTLWSERTLVCNGAHWQSPATMAWPLYGGIATGRSRARLDFNPASPLPLDLPLRPIWPGFAVNTIFYAAVLWMLFVVGGVPFALRRRRRIKRGLCPKCAYPFGTSEICTECGEPLKLDCTRRPVA